MGLPYRYIGHRCKSCRFSMWKTGGALWCVMEGKPAPHPNYVEFQDFFCPTFDRGTPADDTKKPAEKWNRNAPKKIYKRK